MEGTKKPWYVRRLGLVIGIGAHLLLLLAIFGTHKIFNWWDFTQQFGHLPPEQRKAVAAIQEMEGHVALSESGEVIAVHLAFDSYLFWTGDVYLGSHVDDASLACLESLPDLERVHLVGCDQITDMAMSHLTPLTKLRVLEVRYAPTVTDRGLVHLSGLKRLEVLSLSGTAISETGLKHLESLTALETLEVSLSQIADAGKRKLEQALPKCQILWIERDES